MKPDVLVDSNIWIAKGAGSQWPDEYQAILGQFSSLGYCEIIKTELINHRFKTTGCLFSEAEKWCEEVLRDGVPLHPKEHWEDLSARLMNRLAADDGLKGFLENSIADIRIAAKAISVSLPVLTDDQGFYIIQFFAPEDLKLATDSPFVTPEMETAVTNYPRREDIWQKSLSDKNITRKSKLARDINM